MALIYTEDKKAIQQLTRKLGAPEARYYTSGHKGDFKGAHWRTNLTFARSVGKRLAKLISVYK